jgi:hypothetical protein
LIGRALVLEAEPTPRHLQNLFACTEYYYHQIGAAFYSNTKRYARRCIDEAGFFRYDMHVFGVLSENLRPTGANKDHDS